MATATTIAPIGGAPGDATDVQMDAINKYSSLDYPVQPTLFLEFHGTKASVEEQARLVQGIAADNGGGNFQWTTKSEERNKLWQARHDWQAGR